MNKPQSITLEAPRVERRGPLTVVGFVQTYRCDGPNEISAQWQKLMPYIGALPHQQERAAYGVCSDITGKAPTYQYLAGFPVSDTSGLPAELTVIRVPERRYAVFTYRGHVTGLPATVNSILREQLPRLGLTPAGEPGLVEAYDERFDPRSASGEIEVWIAVKD